MVGGGGDSKGSSVQVHTSAEGKKGQFRCNHAKLWREEAFLLRGEAFTWREEVHRMCPSSLEEDNVEDDHSDGIPITAIDCKEIPSSGCDNVECLRFIRKGKRPMLQPIELSSLKHGGTAKTGIISVTTMETACILPTCQVHRYHPKKQKTL